MTTRLAASAWSFWHRGTGVERAGYLVAAALLMSGLVHLGILVAGGGSWAGPLSLRKPATFGLSFGLTLISIVWVASFLRLGDRMRTALLVTFTVACVVETALISVQAWRGVPSHYNVETTFDAWVTRLLAAGGVTLIVIIITLTIAAFRSNPTVPPSLRLSIQAGLVTLLAAQVVGALMVAKGMLLVFGGDAQAAYATGGSLKPAHAATMHAILVLPALAWLLSFTDWSEQRRLRVVGLGAAGYTLLTAGVIVANVVDPELRHPPIAATAAAALGALVVLAAGGLALASWRARRPSTMSALAK